MASFLQLFRSPPEKGATVIVRFLKKIHKWVGLLIGIQVLLWLSSGLMISLWDPAKVSGKEWSTPVAKERSVRLHNNILSLW